MSNIRVVSKYRYIPLGVDLPYRGRGRSVVCMIDLKENKLLCEGSYILDEEEHHNIKSYLTYHFGIHLVGDIEYNVDISSIMNEQP